LLSTVLGNPVTVNLSNLKLSEGREMDGGGIYVAEGVTANLNRVTISVNTADQDGGGIYNQGTVFMENSVVSNNRAFRDGGGIFNFGGEAPSAVYVQSLTVIDHNGANRHGGGIYNDRDNTLVISDSFIESNWASDPAAVSGRGGGIYNRASLQVTESTVRDNTALLEGGGLYFQGGTATLTAVTITENRATNLQGTGKGGGFFIRSGASTSFTSCTLASNTADHDLSRGGYVQNHDDYTWSGPAAEDPVFFQDLA
jgi:hypothetical protein